MTVNNDNISNKQVVINMTANIVSFSANIIISFVLTPFLINTLGKETYSFYPIANTIVSYMSVLTNAMNSMASRFVTVSLVQGKKDDANKYFSSVLFANIILSAIILLPVICIISLLDVWMEVPINSAGAIKGLFLLVLSSAIVNILTSVFGIATFAKNRIDLRSLRELVTAVLRIILLFLLYHFLPPSIVYVGVVTLVIAIVNVCFQIVYTKKLLPEISIGIKMVSAFHMKELLNSSIWNAVNTFGNTIVAGTSMILANIFYGASAAGQYSIVNTVPQFISGVIGMLAGVFYPVITYKFAQNDREGLKKEIKKAQNLIGLFGCAVISVFSVLAKDFFSLWTPQENAEYLSFISFLTIMPHFVISCMWVLTNLNVVMNKVKIPAIFTLLSGIINVMIAYLTYKICAPGLVVLPIISSVLQIVWVGVFIPLYACKCLSIKWYSFYSALFRALLCSAFVILILSQVKKIFSLNSWLRLIVFGGISGILALAIFLIAMFGMRSTIDILKIVVEKIKSKNT